MFFTVYDMAGACVEAKRVPGSDFRTVGGDGLVYTETGSEWDEKIAAMKGVGKPIWQGDATHREIEEMAATAEGRRRPVWYIAGTRHQPGQPSPFLPPAARAAFR